MSLGPVIDEGISLITQATKEDLNKNYTRAIELYELGLAKFSTALKDNSYGELAKISISHKNNIYSERVNEIKEHLKQKQQNR